MRSSRRRAERVVRAAALAATLAVLGAAGVAAAASVTIGAVAWRPADPKTVEVSLVGTLPGDGTVGDARQWSVRSVDLSDGSVSSVHPASVAVDRQDKIVTLTLSAPLEPWDATGDTHDVSVTFFYGDDYVEARLRRLSDRLQAQAVAGASGYKAAKGKADADVYLSGALASARGAKPTYTADVKLQRGFFTASGGRVGASFTLSAANEADIDPDCVKAALSYRRVFTSSPALDLRLDLVSGEFARKDDVRNLASAARLALVPPSLPLGARTFLAFEPFAGFEAGRNLTRKDVSGGRAVARPLAGANAYLLALQPGGMLDRITLGAEFTLRLPRTVEPFTERRDAAAVTALTRRARPHLGVDLAFQFKAGYGFALQYRHGSLPPAFQRIEHRVALGFTVQLVQQHK